MTSVNASELPASWATARVGDLVHLVNGLAFKPSDWKPNGLPIIRIQNLNNPNAPFNRFPGEVPAKFRVDHGELLFAWSGTPGTSFGAHIWRGGPAILNQHIFKVTFDERYLDKRYLQLAINQNLNEYISLAHGGAGLAHITKGKFEDSLLRVAPLGEQRRIAAEIDKHFTRLDAASASLKRAHAKLTYYRAAILRAACEGGLVPTQAELARRHGGTYESAAELLERMHSPGAGAVSLPDSLERLPEGWVHTRVRDVGSVKIGRQRSPKHHHGTHMRPYLRVANVFEDRLDLGDVLTMNFTPIEFEQYRLLPGDILLNEGQSPELLGRPAMYRGELEGACFQNTLVRFRANEGLVPAYALLVFRHYMHSGRFRRLSRQTTNIAHLGGERFAQTEFPLPPYEEQVRIVNEADRLLSIERRLARDIRRSMRRVEAFRRSILKRAFEGRLVPQCPTDEPAEVLLERIRSQRAAAAPPFNGHHRASPTQTQLPIEVSA